MAKNYVILLIIGLVLVNSLLVTAVPYDIASDKDLNKFDDDDYLELTQASIGETLRSSAKNADFMIAVLVFTTIVASIGLLFIYSKKN